MKISETSIHPLDFDALKKGDVVVGELIARAKNIKLGDPRYRLAQMAIRQQIEEERPDLYPRCTGSDITILSDQEAEAYNIDRFKSHVSGMGRDAKRRTRIDTSSFSESARRASESRDRSFNGLALMAKKELRKASKEAALLGEPKKALELTDGE